VIDIGNPMRQIKQALQRVPTLYLELLRLKRWRHWSRDWVVGKTTGVVIDGFPRSANSYFLSAFQLIQERPFNIATHVHAPAQIIRACSLRIPTFVMIRNPADACKSLKALECQCNPKKMSRYLRIPLARYLEDYCSFYSTILFCRDQFTLVHFDEVIRSVAAPIMRMNQGFGTAYIARDLTDEEKAKVFEEGGTHLAPDSDRDRIKSMIEAELTQAATLRKLQLAEDLYNEFTQKAEG
jgi:hypothetical protein